MSKDDFYEAVEVTVPPGSAIARLELSERMYEILMRPDLGDLRVWNADDEFLPFDVRPAKVPVEIHSSELSLFSYTPDPAGDDNGFAVRVELDSGGAVVDISKPGTDAAGALAYLVDLKEERTTRAQLELSWQPASDNRIVRLKLEASKDLDSWRELIGSAALAELRVSNESIRRDRLPTMSLLNERYLRLTWLDTNKAFELDGASLIERDRAPGDRRHRSFEATNTPSPGIFEYDTGLLLPADSVELEFPLGSLVKATLEARSTDDAPWAVVKTAFFYHLTGDVEDIENEPAEIPRTRARHWRVEIDGGTGHSAPTLTLGWQPEFLRFTPRAPGPFYVAYGSAKAQPAQSDLEAVILAIEATGEEVGIAEVGVLSTLPLGGASALRQPLPWTRMALWAVLLVAVAVLGWMALRLVRQMD